MQSLSGINLVLDVAESVNLEQSCCGSSVVKVLKVAQKVLFKAQIWHGLANP